MSDNVVELYNQYAKPHRAALVQLSQEEKKILNLRDENSSDYARSIFRLADIQLSVMSLNLAMYYYSIQVLQDPDTGLYNKARVACFQSTTYYESLLTNEVNPAFSDLKKIQEKTKVFSDKERYYYARKLGLCIDLLQEHCRDYKKQRWYFVDLKLRHVVITRNLLDLTTASAGFAPEKAEFRERIFHFELLQKLFNHVSEEYRWKYESNSRNIKDFQTAILCLDALGAFFRLCGMINEEHKLKRKREVWSAKLQDDI